LTINGKGSLTVTGAASNAIKSKDGIRIVDATVTTTAKKHGVAANDFVNVSGATLNLSADEDGIHSDNEDDVLLGNIYLTNTKITVNAGDDGINASNTMLIDEGATIDVQKSEEGLEARLIHQVGGTVTVKSSDDGLNAKDWTLESSEGQGPGQQTKTVKAEAANVKNLDQAGEVKIVIDGGTLTVDAEGDGLDANGSIEINGGTVVVNGPTSGANAALDYDDNGKLNGGTVLFVDNGEMTMGFGSDSSQAFLMASVQGTAGTTVEVVDSSGKTVASLKASKAFSTVLISSPEIKEGEKYTIKVGSNSTTATASKQAANIGGGPGQGGPGGGQPGQGGRPGGR
ncbi:MAG: carbohydrate-binding domain-containing protein, partial [Streptococcus sp.]|nr:carbohydrate-binding domain-containing protein [Streptococcus sp.]